MAAHITPTDRVRTVTHHLPRTGRARVAARALAPVAGLAMLALVASPLGAGAATEPLTIYAPAAGITLDTDGDGLIDERELQIGTDPAAVDTDGDTVGDGEEVDEFGTDPLAVDTDGDGFDDAEEINGGTDPLDADDNPDTVIDLDGDGDQLIDEVELSIGTDPDVFDTDGDGIGDGAEVDGFKTDPLDADTDGDGYDDGGEIFLYKTDPRDADSFPADTSASPSARPSAQPSTAPAASAAPVTLPSTGTGSTLSGESTSTGLLALIAAGMAAVATAAGLRRRQRA